jgi:hypothetical protein
MTQTKRKKHRSRGEMISTFSFFIASAFFIGESNLLHSEGAILQALLIGTCGVLCLAAGFRFHLHNLWYWFWNVGK